MNNELREAAERLLDKFGYASIQHIDDSTECDASRIAEQYLAEHLPDDNELVENAWLRSILIQGREFQYHDSMPDFLNLYNDEFDVDIESMKGKPITRGQVRLLLRALQ